MSPHTCFLLLLLIFYFFLVRKDVSSGLSDMVETEEVSPIYHNRYNGGKEKKAGIQWAVRNWTLDYVEVNYWRGRCSMRKSRSVCLCVRACKLIRAVSWRPLLYVEKYQRSLCCSAGNITSRKTTLTNGSWNPTVMNHSCNFNIILPASNYSSTSW
jgi:hypothetical protein